VHWVLEATLRSLLGVLLFVGLFGALCGVLYAFGSSWDFVFTTTKLRRDDFDSDGMFNGPTPLNAKVWNYVWVAPNLGDVTIPASISVSSLVVGRGTTLHVEGSVETRSGEVGGKGKVVARDGVSSNY
jgi:hypothetical protein